MSPVPRFPKLLRALTLGLGWSLIPGSFAAEPPLDPTPVPAPSGRVTLRNSGQALGDAETYGSGVALGDVDGDGDLNAVSPHALDLRGDRSRFYRLRQFPER